MFPCASMHRSFIHYLYALHMHVFVQLLTRFSTCTCLMCRENHLVMMVSPQCAKWDHLLNEECKRPKWNICLWTIFPCCVEMIAALPSEEPEMWTHRGGRSSSVTNHWKCVISQSEPSHRETKVLPRVCSLIQIKLSDYPVFCHDPLSCNRVVDKAAALMFLWECTGGDEFSLY